MLTSGMVPALFPDDEKEGIIGQVIIDWLSKYSRTDSHIKWTQVLVGNFLWAWLKIFFTLTRYQF